jgi:hypothetical protein
MNRSQKISAAAVQYGLSLLSGMAMFVALKVLQHIAPSNESFSRLSLILLSFTTFQIITDLGTQTEFLRSWQSTAPENRGLLVRILIHSRLLLGGIALATAIFYAMASGFSEKMTVSFVIYHLAFLPFSLITTADSLFLAQQQFGKAVIARAARIISLSGFIVAAAFIPEHAEILGPLLSTLCFSAASAVVWIRVISPLLQADGSIQLFSSHWWTHTTAVSKSFLRGSSLASVITGIQVLYGIAAHSILVRTVGEDRLTPMNTAVALATPAILAFQTLVQIVFSSLPAWTSLNRREVAGRYAIFFLRSVLILIFMSSGLWAANAAGLVSWFFPMTTSAVLPLCQFLIIAQWTLNLCAPAINLCQYQKKYIGVFTILLLSVTAALAVQIWWNRLLLEHAYLIGLTLSGAILSVGAITLSVRGQPTSQANS